MRYDFQFIQHLFSAHFFHHKINLLLSSKYYQKLLILFSKGVYNVLQKKDWMTSFRTTFITLSCILVIPAKWRITIWSNCASFPIPRLMHKVLLRNWRKRNSFNWLYNISFQQISGKYFIKKAWVYNKLETYFCKVKSIR